MKSLLKLTLIFSLFITFHIAAQEIKFGSLKKQLVEKKAILEPLYNAELQRKGFTCFTLGEIQYAAESILASDLIISKAEKRLRKKINKFLVKDNFYCSSDVTPFLIDALGDHQQNKLKRRYLKFDKRMNTWMADYTEAGWENNSLKIELKQEMNEIIAALEFFIPLFRSDSFYTGWKPGLCRKIGFFSAKQDAVNFLLAADLKNSVAYSEIISSQKDLKSEVCGSIRGIDKFIRELTSWVENLKVIKAKI